MDLSNIDFIDENGFRCPICGGVDLVPSVITLQANYGSTGHDGEIITLHVCGDCIDRIINHAESILKKDDYNIVHTLPI